MHRSVDTMSTESGPPTHDPLLRAASFTDGMDHGDDFGFAFSFSEEDLLPPSVRWRSDSEDHYHERDDDYDQAYDSDLPTPPRIYSKASEIPQDSKISITRTLYVSENSDANFEQDAVDRSAAPPTNSQRTMSLTRTLSSLGLKAKRASPPSPSLERPSAKTQMKRSDSIRSNKSRTNDDSKSNEGKISRSRSQRKNKPDGQELPPGTSPREGRPRSFLSRKSRKSTFDQQINAYSSDSPEGTVALNGGSRHQLSRSFSHSNVPLHRGNDELSDELSSNTKQRGKIPVLSTSVANRRDELWGVFRDLDAAFQRFDEKSLALKAVVVRSDLLPFLRKYANHPSNHRLKPEELDRRVSILDKWWTALLDLMCGNSKQVVSGTDRPSLLEAIAGIMERQEWRAMPSSFASLSDRQRYFEDRYDDGSSSPVSESEAFVFESVHHNVRNIFVQHLFKQVVFVVDKMSLRNAPASLVSFCGKACAFAFFFCPGIADILVRLWDIQYTRITKIMKAYGVDKTAVFQELSDSIAAVFPQCLHSLSFQSAQQMFKLMRQKPVLPLGIEKVQWHGYWLNRWSGRDSDLFYFFVKCFHKLVVEFLPEDASTEEKICVPGLMLVHTQMLTNLDSTINRVSGMAEMGLPLNIISDDGVVGDARATIIPSLPINAARTMTDNRFIMLLREHAVELQPQSYRASHFLATSFCVVLKASVQSTSMYKQASCFTLCDFLQEAFILLGRIEAQQSPKWSIIDWPFWLDVFQQMFRSHNTTTEVRLYSLIFTTWNTIKDDPAWHMTLCRDILLNEEHFDATFNHWCPMIRAYYMRLLCWRIARCDDESTDQEKDLVWTLFTRLRRAWSFYQYFEERAQIKGQVPPSTAPSNPAPGRRLLIIRQDSPIMNLQHLRAQANALEEAMSEESADSQSQLIQPLKRNDSSSTSTVILDKVSSTLEQLEVNRKKGTLIRALLGYKAEDEPRPDSPTPSLRRSSSPSPANSTQYAHRSTSPEKSGSSRSSIYEARPTHPVNLNNQAQTHNSTQTLEGGPRARMGKGWSRARTQTLFRFSLEQADRREVGLIKELDLEHPRLPLSAQLLVESQLPFTCSVGPSSPSHTSARNAAYSGRALAEWMLVVNECQNFFDRRRTEGVMSNQLVEIPLLGVESFRRL